MFISILDLYENLGYDRKTISSHVSNRKRKININKI